MSYTSLPEKYRPKKWEDLVGHETEVSRLRGMIKTNKIPHAILFAGQSGVGKTTLAKMFASYAASDDDEPLPLSEIDFVEVNGAEKRGIDDIRELIEIAKYMPLRGKYKFIYIDEAQDLTPAAAKALLIPTENPPEKTIYMFSSMEAEKLLPALVGRCSVFNLNLPSTKQIAKRLKKICKKENIDFLETQNYLDVASATGGQVRNAVSMLESIIQYVEGDSSGKDVDYIVNNAIKNIANIGEDVIAAKVLLALCQEDVASVHANILEASNFNTLIQKMTYLNLFVLDVCFVGQHEKIWYTTANKNYLQSLQKHLGTDLKKSAKTFVKIQSTLNQIKMDLGTFLATDRAVFSARLCSLAYALKEKNKE